MTRYYFDIRDGKAFVKDDEGMELPDIAGHPMSIEVRDSEGPLFLLSFDFLRRSA